MTRAKAWGGWLGGLGLVLAAGCAEDAATTGTAEGGWFSTQADVLAASDATGGTDGASGWTSMKDTAASDSAALADDVGWPGAPAEDAAGASDAAGGGTTTPGVDGDLAQAWKKEAAATPLPQVVLGGGKTLALVDLRVTVQVEGLRARTLVDHIFYNEHPQTLEGTFRYALPPEATVSYYALFPAKTAQQPQFFGSGDPLAGADDETVAAKAPSEVAAGADPGNWAPPKEARVVAQAAAVKAYEEETAKKIDPAVVEEVAPNTFEARVFPIPASGWCRVLIAYEQTLPRAAGKLQYKMLIPKGKVPKLDFLLLAPKALVTSVAPVVPLPAEAKVKDGKGSTLVRWQPQDLTEGALLAFDLQPAQGSAEADLVAGTDPATKKTYAYVRLQPKLDGLAGQKGGAKRAVFLLDTSLSARPQQFDLNMVLLGKVLEKSPGIQQFRVMTFDAGARWLQPAFVANDAAGRKQVVDLMDGALLEGGTNLASALALLAKETPQDGDPALDVFLLSDGLVNWGETSIPALVARFQAEAKWQARFFAYRTGLAENLALFQALTTKGAVFNCQTPEQLEGCASGHQTTGLLVQKVVVEPAPGSQAVAKDVLVAGRQATLFPGATLTVALRVEQPGAAQVRVIGTVPGAGPQEVVVPVTLLPAGELAPRAWAEVAVAQLLETHDEKHEELALALSQHYGIASPRASFLVLESEQAYDKYDLKDISQLWQGQDVAVAIEAGLQALGKAWTSWDGLLQTLQEWDGVIALSNVLDGKLIQTMAGQAGPQGLQLPDSELAVPLAKQTEDVPQDYLQILQTKDAQALAGIAKEAERRRNLGQTGLAVRALSGAVELNPGNAEVARLTGYRLQAWQQGPTAAALLLGVARKRPFEPQSWRDLANALWTERPAVTAIGFEAVLAGNWPAQYKQLKTVTKEEYALFVQDLAQSDPKHPLNETLKGRKTALGLENPSGDLRVTLTWNTLGTDVDLWVTDPNGEKCYYSHKKLASGGQLLDDLTQGFGPERFLAQKAIPGKYKIQAHFYGNNGNKLVAETFVTAVVMTRLGTPAQTVERYDLLLPKVGEVVEVADVVFK